MRFESTSADQFSFSRLSATEIYWKGIMDTPRLRQQWGKVPLRSIEGVKKYPTAPPIEFRWLLRSRLPSNYVRGTALKQLAMRASQESCKGTMCS